MSNANVPDRTAKRTTPIGSSLSVSKPPVRIHPTAVIGDKASLVGVHTITIGPNVVIHPYARLSSQHGSISIGAGCIISERSWIGLLDAAPERSLLHVQRGGQDPAEPEANVVLCDNVTVQPGAVVQASSVGKWSVVEINAKIEPGCVLGEVTLTIPFLRDSFVLIYVFSIARLMLVSRFLVPPSFPITLLSMGQTMTAASMKP